MKRLSPSSVPDVSETNRAATDLQWCAGARELPIQLAVVLMEPFPISRLRDHFWVEVSRRFGGILERIAGAREQILYLSQSWDTPGRAWQEAGSREGHALSIMCRICPYERQNWETLCSGADNGKLRKIRSLLVAGNEISAHTPGGAWKMTTVLNY